MNETNRTDKSCFLVSPPPGFRIKAWLRKTPPALWLYRRRRRKEADVYLLSFPKAGRTWLRMLIGKALADQFGIQNPDVIELHRLAEGRTHVPRIRVKHDDDPHMKAPEELVTRKSEYRDCKVILLVRNIHDLAVSTYFQATKREGLFTGDISSFLRCRRGSAASIIRFHNIWAENRTIPREFLLVRYEDLRTDAAGELAKIWRFLGLPELAPEKIAAAVQFCSFENMRKMETQDQLSSGRLRASDPSDPESFKTRQGKVGGYKHYLSTEDIVWLDERVNDELSPFYGYNRSP
jgi:hypothetical protein